MLELTEDFILMATAGGNATETGHKAGQNITIASSSHSELSVWTHRKGVWYSFFPSLTWLLISKLMRALTHMRTNAHFYNCKWLKAIRLSWWEGRREGKQKLSSIISPTSLPNLSHWSFLGSLLQIIYGRGAIHQTLYVPLSPAIIQQVVNVVWSKHDFFWAPLWLLLHA